ncbi:hypothetical protein C1I60_00990 [Paenibacillus terrae]|uniref:Uncharacterized protein n=1 Tax=Paenibacillus terrae TaxID=159743 RepID=A0A4U2Q3L0_9BACL|nr:hypothetical protein C1I60_00990 [Paenibacillus terrae]
MYRTGRLINGKLFLKTLSGDWISLQMLIKPAISEHPNFKSKVPRLDTVKGIAQINPNCKAQVQWFNLFK